MTEEQREELSRPYRILFAAVIERAVIDVREGGASEATAAVDWLMHSEDCADYLQVLGIDVKWFRDRLRQQPWFQEASRRVMCRVLNPLLSALT